MRRPVRLGRRGRERLQLRQAERGERRQGAEGGHARIRRLVGDARRRRFAGLALASAGAGAAASFDRSRRLGGRGDLGRRLIGAEAAPGTGSPAGSRSATVRRHGLVERCRRRPAVVEAASAEPSSRMSRLISGSTASAASVGDSLSTPPASSEAAVAASRRSAEVSSCSARRVSSSGVGLLQEAGGELVQQAADLLGGVRRTGALPRRCRGRSPASGRGRARASARGATGR